MTDTTFETLAGQLHELKMDLKREERFTDEPTAREYLREAWEHVVRAQGKLNAARNAQILAEQ